jgi:hypothetical protein
MECTVKQHLKIAAALALVVLVAACAAGVNPAAYHPDQGGNIAGFFSGFWHGLIVWFAFFFTLFTDSVSIYDANNNGGWYDFGYLLGLSCSLGGGTTVIVRASR